MGCGSSKPAVVDDSILLARHLSGILDLPEESQIIQTYVSALHGEGYEKPDAFDGLTLLELAGDFVFKKGHVKKVRPCLVFSVFSCCISLEFYYSDVCFAFCDVGSRLYHLGSRLTCGNYCCIKLSYGFHTCGVARVFVSTLR